MHDPKTVAFEIKSPFRQKPSKLWPKGYRRSFVTIWHVDPERDGSDDSCGWFMRGRHLSQADRDLARNLITNEYDNLKDWVVGRDDKEKISRIIGIFACLRRRDRSWWKHPRWHFWHWEFQVHDWQMLRRWMFSRCAGCGKRFSYGYCPTGFQWHSPKPKWFCSEVDVYHSECASMRMTLHREPAKGTA